MQEAYEPFLQTRDRAVLAICLFGLMASGFILLSESAFTRLFGERMSVASSPLIGRIERSTNDIRHKNAGSLIWERANPKQSVHLGDSVFTAASSTAVIQLKNGTEVTLGQNSLVTFRSLNNLTIPNFATGNFRIHVNGELTISAAGHIREIHGDHADVQIAIADGHPVIRALKGNALINGRNGYRKLNLETVGDNPPLDQRVTVTPVLSSAPYVYVWRVSDLYQTNTSSPRLAIALRSTPASWASFDANVNWATSGVVENVYGELAETPQFAVVKSAFVAPAKTLQSEFKTVHLGLNYVRLSVDDKHWSATQSFQVLPRYLEELPPALAFRRSHYFILNGKAVSIRAQIDTPKGETFSSFIVEATRENSFAAKHTQVAQLTGDAMHFVAQTPGVYFFRVRGVDNQDRLTVASSPYEVDIEQPALPAAPQIQTTELQMYVGENKILSWPSAERAAQYKVQIANLKSGKKNTRMLLSPALRLNPQKTGQYNLTVTALDRFGRVSSNAADIRLVVLEKKPMQPLPMRELAQESVTAKLPPGYENYMNRNMFRSNLAFELGGFTMYSRDLLSAGQVPPDEASIGVRWLNWFDNNGVGARFFAKVADVSAASGTAAAPTDVELRYERRWRPAINPFSLLKSAQVALISGVEVYKGGSSVYFSPGYQLAKIGIGLDFPTVKRWSTGGEILYGQGLDSTKKYEMSGYCNYFWKVNWVIGLGYKVDFMEAGSNAEAPVSVPYREGSAGAYTVLKWFY